MEQEVMESKVITRLKEMSEEMPSSIDNLKKLVIDQQELIDVIINSDKKERFNDLIESMQKQVQDYLNQIDTLNSRKDALDLFLAKCDNDPELVKLVDEFATVIGLA